MKKIKSYLVFAPMLYRVVVFSCPILLLGVEVLLRLNGKNNMVYPLSTILIVVELFADFWLLGGICNKKESGVEYLKTSIFGKQMLKNVVVINLIRTMAAFILVVIGCAVIDGILFGWSTIYDLKYMLMYLMYILWGYGITVISQLITRHFTGYYAYIIFSYLAVMVNLIPALCMVAGYLYLILVIGAVLVMASSVVMIWYVMRKVEKSYYDREN